MTAKLPVLKPAEMVKTLLEAGFVVVRQTGGHVIMYKKGLLRPIPIPVHPKTLKKELQQGIIKEAGFTPEEFRRFL